MPFQVTKKIATTTKTLSLCDALKARASNSFSDSGQIEQIESRVSNLTALVVQITEILAETGVLSHKDVLKLVQDYDGDNTKVRRIQRED